MEHLNGILLTVFTMIVILSLLLVIFPRVNKSSAEASCMASIALRDDFTYSNWGAELRPPIFLCNTIKDINIPSSKKAEKKIIIKEFADEIASTAKVFGRGEYSDILKDVKSVTKEPCIVYKEITIKESEYFKRGDKISNQEVINFMMDNIYSTDSQADFCKTGGGFCESQGSCSIREGQFKFDKNSQICKKNKQGEEFKGVGCCYSTYSCLNNGGECRYASKGPEYMMFSDWKCPKNQNCYIKKEEALTYIEYVQNGGKEVIVFLSDSLEPNNIYAISYGDKKKTSLASTALTAGGTTIGAGLVLAYLGLTPVTIPVTLGTAAVGLVMVVVSGGEAMEEVTKYFQENEVSVIYVGTLDQIYKTNLCEIVDS